MIKALLALGVFFLTLTVFAQEVETEVDKSYNVCLQEAMFRFKKYRGRELRKDHGMVASSVVKRSYCDEKTMTCRITGFFQYDNAKGKKVILSVQEVAFTTDKEGLCLEGVFVGKPSLNVLKGQ